MRIFTDAQTRVNRNYCMKKERKSPFPSLYYSFSKVSHEKVSLFPKTNLKMDDLKNVSNEGQLMCFGKACNMVVNMPIYFKGVHGFQKCHCVYLFYFHLLVKVESRGGMEIVAL